MGKVMGFETSKDKGVSADDKEEKDNSESS
jgi:hypothetical protein